MSVKPAGWRLFFIIAALLAALGLLTAEFVRIRGRAAPEHANRAAIRATLESVVATNNDVTFVYVLENRTGADYRIPEQQAVELRARSASTHRLLAKLPQPVTGDFPLLLPARSKTHFALVVTSDREVQPDDTAGFRKRLGVDSFLLFDPVRSYEVEFPLWGASQGN